MILSDYSLKKAIENKIISISPMCDNTIQPASLDLRLGNNFRQVAETNLGIDARSAVDYREITASKIIIPSKSFILATTMEYLEIPDNMAAFVEGRSSIGRMGLFIQNAGWVDPGFKGEITLELFNANSVPITLEAGMRICQLVLCLMTTTADNPYQGKYQNQTGATGTRISEDV